MIKHSAVFRYLSALVIFSSITPAFGQTSEVLKNLVVNHGSLAAGDVVFTNFRQPLLVPNTVVLLGDTFPALPDGADVSVSASVAADGRINLVFTAIDPATGLPKPYRTNAKPGAALPTDILKYVEYDVVVTNPIRRLHGFDRSFGPGTTAVFGNSAFNWVYFFDATSLNQYTGVAFDQIVNGQQFYNVGAVTLHGGDRAGARFGVQWGISASDWGGIRVGTGSLDRISLSYSLAAAAPGAPVAVGISSFFADAVYLTSPAPVGGTTIALSSSDATVLVVPASVTVPQGSIYSAYRAVKQPVQNWLIATVTGTFNGTAAVATENVFVGEAVGAGPVPTLSVTLNGKGKVTNIGQTLNCGIVCSVTPVGGVLNGWRETLTATAGSGSTFTGWTGACSGSAPTCTVIVGGLVKVGATFTPIPSTGGGGGGGSTTSNPTLKVSTSNPGTVTSNVGGINCGTVCSATVAPNTVVTLTAIPPAGLTFAGWSGACIGTISTCTVNVNANLSVKASFNK